MKKNIWVILNLLVIAVLLFGTADPLQADAPKNNLTQGHGEIILSNSPTDQRGESVELSQVPEVVCSPVTEGWDDTTPPCIDNIEESDDPINKKEGCGPPTTVTIWADVFDESCLEWVRLYYLPVGENSWEYIDMSYMSGDTYEATIGPFTKAGTVNYRVKALDSWENEAQSSRETVTVKDCDTTPPDIDNIRASPDPINRQGCPEPTTVTIRADVTDASGLEWVRLYYQPPGGSSWNFVAMSRESGDTYKATLGPFSQAGTLSYRVNARDNARNEALSDTKTVTVKDCLTPIIIVPGYGASLCFRGICGWMPTAEKTYDKLIQALVGAGYEFGKNLIIGYYPWWRPNAESAKDYLAKIWVERALKASPNGKVHIITHSNGGLVARQYIQAAGSSHVDKLIMIAPPSQGVPKAYYYWGGGAFPPGDFDDWSKKLDEAEINVLVRLLCPTQMLRWLCIRQFMPSWQELMPVVYQDYLCNVNNTRECKKPGDLTEENQNPNLDELNAAISDLFNDVEGVVIYGSEAHDTLSMLRVKNRGILDWPRWADGKPIPGDQKEGKERGDGTIPEIHQHLPNCMSYLNCQEDFRFSAKHGPIVSQVRNCVLYELGLASECKPAPMVVESVSDEDVVFFGMVTEARWLISDPQGRRAGYLSNGQFVSEIPGVEVFEGAEYHVIGIPKPIAGDYTVQVTGIAGTQSYNVGAYTYLSGDTLLQAEGTVSSGSTRTVIALYAPPSTLTGSVTLQGRPSPPGSSWVTDLDVGLYLPSDDSLLYSYSATTDIYGRFTIPNVPRGTYNIWVKGDHTLSNVKSNMSIGVGTNEVNFGALLEGDANDDNCVNAPDFSILRTAFSKCQGQEGYDARADFDQDGCVNAPDFSLLRTNFGLCGDITV